jgi:medium-chain acyl-[acyl-carrier-protein] hydrolase
MRIAETPATSMPDLVEAISESVAASDSGTPSLFFGHCAGAMLAYECAVALQDKGARLPLALFASSAPAPASWNGERMTYALDGMDPLEVYQQLGGMPVDFREDPELADAIRSVLRADTLLYRGYTSSTNRPLPLPIVTFTALGDRLVPPGLAHQWQQHTTNPLRGHDYAGHHFTMLDQPAALVDLITRELA